MIIAHIEGATRICGKAQGYRGLPLRDEVINDAVNGEGTPAMVTAWQPTPEELAALNAGASVHVRILGTKPPPMMVGVGPAPEPAAAPAQDALAARIDDATDVIVRDYSGGKYSALPPCLTNDERSMIVRALRSLK
ncbi:hypothetical protein [Bradyrhizobium sp. 147]|uniref:hypothetical protein n=1 Tax=Bradyrhizobium sp. 147 TaxID=2782623 RepID=UPI001FF94833|nr:hypothetical protein [Bradyrhizobium sp. 147]